jgi:hypothetical protein
MVEALRAEGFDVWWDHGIQAGSEWDRSIHKELYAAKVVIAIWSNASVAAPWVKEEATVGRNRGVLLPVRIDEVDPPLGFMMIQAADLIDWRGDRTDQRWGFFLGAVKAIMRGGSALGAVDAPVRRRAGKNRLLAPGIAAALVLVAGVALAAWHFIRERAPAPPVNSAPPPQSIAVQTTPPPKISEGEQKLWDTAVKARSRQAFQSYLLAYPNGVYAQRARDTLLTCRTETAEVWKPGPDVANQMVRGVSGGPLSSGITTEQHCAKAKADVRARARLMCETIATNGGYRNPKWTVADSPCDCKQPNKVVMTCIADLAYSCRWEMRVTERTEICG